MQEPFRHAILSDTPRIERLLKQFYEKQGHVYGISYNPVDCLSSIIDTVVHGVAIVGPNSCAGGALTPFFANSQAIVCTCLYWYFTESREIEVFDAFLEAAKSKGAMYITAASHYPNNTIMRYYDKKGLHPVEAYSMMKL